MQLILGLLNKQLTLMNTFFLLTIVNHGAAVKL